MVNKFGNMMSFILNEAETLLYEQFVHDNKDNKRNKPIKLTFFSTGIVTVIIVKKGNIKKDITDYESW